MTIWLFGASCAYEDNDDKTWQRMLAKSINTELKNFGLAGVGLEYCFHKFHEQMDNITKGDIVIFCYTQIGRKWFFQDRPRLTGLYSVDRASTQRWNSSSEYYVSENERNAIKHTHIHTKPIISFRELFLTVLNSMDVKSIVLNVFSNEKPDNYKDLWEQKYSNITFSKGFLYDITIDEFADKELWNNTMDKSDPRESHLCYQNHKILHEDRK